MPRQPRLDIPATLHHVMVRDLACRVLIKDDAKRDNVVTRAASLAGTEARSVSAWTLLWGQTRGTVARAAHRGAGPAARTPALVSVRLDRSSYVALSVS